MRQLLTFAVLFTLSCSAVEPPRAPAPVPGMRVDAAALPALASATPISADEYAARRRTLIGAVGDGALVIFGAAAPAADYLPFTQLADFRYITGIMEPGAAYIAVKRGA